jgi:hypothetical protein
MGALYKRKRRSCCCKPSKVGLAPKPKPKELPAKKAVLAQWTGTRNAPVSYVTSVTEDW